MEVKENKMYIGQYSAEELVKEYGSPLYVYDQKVIEQKYKELTEAITYPKLKMLYACKANTNISVLKVLQKLGCGIDAVSPGEVEVALDTGFKPKDILYTGNNSSEEEMEYVISKDVMINVGSLMQLEKYGEINPKSKVSVRINPDVGAGHHSHVITGGPDSKFGIYFDKVDEIKDVAEKHDLKITGVHMHVGSLFLDSAPFLKAMQALLNVAGEMPELEFVDFGGGVGVPYKPGEDRLDIKKFGSDVSAMFWDFCKNHDKEFTMMFENGRYYVAEAGFLLTKATNVKETPKFKFVGTDTGFNHLVRPAMYGSYHEIMNASNVKDTQDKVVVAGNICESGDVFTRGEEGPVPREISKINEGDVLAILNAGAYGYSMASNYNTRPRPAEVLVNDEEAELARKRETIKDLTAGEKTAGWL